MPKTEPALVTVKEYSLAVTASVVPEPAYWADQQMYPNRPVVYVSGDDAMAYAKWVEGWLPTSDVWEARRHEWWTVPLWEWTATEEGVSPRVVRGGSFDNLVRRARAASRYRSHPSFRDYDLGFRVVVSHED